jgi:DNA-binding NarL/FixJ family response regulator
MGSINILIFSSNSLLKLALTTRLSVIFFDSKIFCLNKIPDILFRRPKMKGAANLVLVDVCDDLKNEITKLVAMKKNFPDAKFVVMTNKCSSCLLELELKALCDLVLAKSSSSKEIFSSIYELVAGKGLHNLEPSLLKLTRRQMEIIRLVNLGMSNSEVSEILMICENTVKVHLNRLFKKFKVSSRIQLLAICRVSGCMD